MSTLSVPSFAFWRHYVEMVVAMLLGMLVLGGGSALLLTAAGVDVGDLRDEAPALDLAWMAATMTVPMVWWMLRRGHGWARAWEMTGAMVLPALGVILLLATDAVTDIGALMAIEHSVMFPAMLVVMLARRDEYEHAH